MALTFAVFLYRKHLKVHVNLRRIMINTALHYTILAPSRLVTMVLMMDWGSNEPLDYNMTFRIFETLKDQYVFVAAFTLPASAIERFCSVRYIADYECVPRTRISFFIIIVLDLFCFSQTFILVFMGMVPITLPFGLVGVANVAAVAIFRHCYSKTMRHYNASLQRVNQMKSSKTVPNAYSLSLRFQIIENMRVAKFVRALYWLIVVLSVTTAAPLIVAMLFENEVIVSVFSEAFSMGIVIYANVVPSVVLCSIPKFRHDVWRVCRLLSRNRAATVNTDERDDAADAKKYTAEEEANVYFVQLQSMWA